MSNEILLPNTTLLIIAYEEEINAAGGIERLLPIVVPRVEKVIIGCTDSDKPDDGTLEILREAEKEYPNLTVYETPFDGYANMRNRGVKKVRTRYALTLDTDELLLPEDFEQLRSIVAATQGTKKWPMGWNLKWRNIYPEKEDLVSDTANPRLFEVSHIPFRKTRYHQGINEYLMLGTDYHRMEKMPDHLIETDVEIKHFCPGDEALIAKHEQLYEPMRENKYLPDDRFGRFICRMWGNKMQPRPVFEGVVPWKQPNPKRDLYL